MGFHVLCGAQYCPELHRNSAKNFKIALTMSMYVISTSCGNYSGLSATATNKKPKINPT
jgi:hypothetical protein